MPRPLHVEIDLAAAPDRVWQALTADTELTTWWSEHASVDLAGGRYDFWGRYTPETPGAGEGVHPLDVLGPQWVRYTWPLRGVDTTVELRVVSRGGGSVLGVWHHDLPDGQGMADYAFEDVWFLGLENLRRHLSGRAPVRCDFTALPLTGDVRHQVDIDGSPDAVWQALIDPTQLERWIASSATVVARAEGTWDLGWGPEGVLQILTLDPGRKLSLKWEMGKPTTITWELDGSGGRTRVTFTHSGFDADEGTGGIQAGWLNFLSWVKSLVEFGPDWYPAIKEITKAAALLYAATITARQEMLEWKEEHDTP